MRGKGGGRERKSGKAERDGQNDKFSGKCSNRTDAGANTCTHITHDKTITDICWGNNAAEVKIHPPTHT